MRGGGDAGGQDDGHLMLVAVPPSNRTQSMATRPLMPHAHHTHATKVEGARVDMADGSSLAKISKYQQCQIKQYLKLEVHTRVVNYCTCKTFCLNIIVIRCRSVDISHLLAHYLAL